VTNDFSGRPFEVRGGIMKGSEQLCGQLQLAARKFSELLGHISRNEGQYVAIQIVAAEISRRAIKAACLKVRQDPRNEIRPRRSRPPDGGSDLHHARSPPAAAQDGFNRAGICLSAHDGNYTGTRPEKPSGSRTS
jgi:hypothetical protein